MSKNFKLPIGHESMCFCDPNDTRRIIVVQHRRGYPKIYSDFVESMQKAAEGYQVFSDLPSGQEIAKDFDFVGQTVPRRLVNVRVFSDDRPTNVCEIDGDLMALICDRISQIEPDFFTADQVRQAHLNAAFPSADV